jgi:hypothetical protein
MSRAWSACLHTQQRDNAVFDFVAFLDADAVLLVDTVGKLATILALAGLENHEMAALGFPVQARDREVVHGHGE